MIELTIILSLLTSNGVEQHEIVAQFHNATCLEARVYAFDMAYEEFVENGKYESLEVSECKEVSDD